MARHSRHSGLKHSRTLQDASCAAYVASVLVDRAQPLLRSLQRASKRAEKELAVFGALAKEGTPAPQAEGGEGVADAGRASSVGRGRKHSFGEVGGGMPPPAKRARTARTQVGLFSRGAERLV